MSKEEQNIPKLLSDGHTMMEITKKKKQIDHRIIIREIENIDKKKKNWL